MAYEENAENVVGHISASAEHEAAKCGLPLTDKEVREIEVVLTRVIYRKLAAKQLKRKIAA